MAPRYKPGTGTTGRINNTRTASTSLRLLPDQLRALAYHYENYPGIASDLREYAVDMENRHGDDPR